MSCQTSKRTTTPSVSVIVTALNEARNIPHVFAGRPADVHEVILVDGNSADDTVSAAAKAWPGVKIIMQTDQDKGNALACGFAAAIGDIIVTLDADGSADAREVPRLWKRC